MALATQALANRTPAAARWRWAAHPRVLKASTVAADLVAIAASMVIASRFRSLLMGGDIAGIRPRNALLGLVSLPIWVAAFSRYRLYSTRHIGSRLQEFRLLVHAAGVSVLGMAAASFILRLSVARGWIAIVFVTSLIVLPIEREIVRSAFVALRRRGRLLRRVVVVGSNGEARALASKLTRNRRLGYRVLGLVCVEPGDLEQEGSEHAFLGSSDQLFDVLRTTNANSVIITASGVDAANTNRLVRDLTAGGIHVELSFSLHGISAHRLTVRPLGDWPLMYLEPVRRNGWRAAAKRTFDLVFAGGALVVLSPVFAIIWLSIKLTSPGPGIIRQTRVGYHGRCLGMFKFRTMFEDAETLLAELRSSSEVDGPLFKMRSDPRVTRVGRTLRSFSLDELPQLWNVVRGDMSLVGPRPAFPAEADQWDPTFAAQRLSTKPGITGMWQVSGRSKLTYEDYVRHDLYYVDNWSLWTDLAILAKTIPTVLFRRGAY